MTMGEDTKPQGWSEARVRSSYTDVEKLKGILDGELGVGNYRLSLRRDRWIIATEHPLTDDQVEKLNKSRLQGLSMTTNAPALRPLSHMSRTTSAASVARQNRLARTGDEGHETGELGPALGLSRTFTATTTGTGKQRSSHPRTVLQSLGVVPTFFVGVAATKFKNRLARNPLEHDSTGNRDEC